MLSHRWNSFEVLWIVIILSFLGVTGYIIKTVARVVTFIFQIPKRVRALFHKKKDVILSKEYLKREPEKIEERYRLNKLTVEHSKESGSVSNPSFKHIRDLWVRDQTKELDETLSVIDYVESEPINNINYSNLLSCVEWRATRIKVLVRDKFKCRDCGVRNKSNHVHHTYYLKDTLPWVIDSEALVTVCDNCHSERHRKESIGVYEFKLGKRIRTSNVSIYCGRCNGSGYLPQYKHVQNGVCFACEGACINKTLFSKALEKVKLGIKSLNREDVRIDYRQYLESISEYEYENSIHFINRFPSKPPPPSSSYIDDDLPF